VRACVQSDEEVNHRREESIGAGDGRGRSAAETLVKEGDCDVRIRKSTQSYQLKISISGNYGSVHQSVGELSQSVPVRQSGIAFKASPSVGKTPTRTDGLLATLNSRPQALHASGRGIPRPTETVLPWMIHHRINLQ